jgi:ribosomal RNA-processing protein 8
MLARSLIPKGHCILSFDLVAEDAFVLEADVCEKIPLPGIEADLADGDQGQVVDVCVCALSLMSLDWIYCIRETWRILRAGLVLGSCSISSLLNAYVVA